MLSRKLIFRILSFWILTCGWALAQIPGGHIGIVRDWSHRHVIFTNGGSAMTQAAEMRDARLLHSWVYRNSMLLRADRGRDWRPFPHPGNRGDSQLEHNFVTAIAPGESQCSRAGRALRRREYPRYEVHLRDGA